MGRLAVLGTGLALAVTATLLSSLWVAVAALWQALAFSTAWVGGSNLQLLRAMSPATLTDLLYGLIAIAAIGFVIGSVYAWVYNAMGDIGRAKGW